MLPLDGVKVIDFTRVLSGPFCTMVLADLGADVLKVERFPGGDESRRLGPHHNGESYCFAMANRNKRSIALDLKSQVGREIAHKLIGSADVVVENFRPGVASRLGIDHELPEPDHPHLIYCSITGFGQTGPYRLRAGYDIIAQGITGFLRMTGHPDGRPAKVGIAINDIAAGATAVQAILAAYIHRLKTGQGQYIDVSLVDSGLAWTIWESAAYFGSGEVPQPTGTRHRRAAPHQAYRTLDGYITAGGNNERLWRRFCTDVMERPEWLDDPRYADLASRLEHADELERDIESVSTTMPTAYWVDKLDAARVPGGPVYTYDETLADEHVLARGMVQEIEHPKLGRTRTLSPVPKLSETPPEIRSAAPWLGQHSAQALAELGFTDAEIDDLFAEGTVFDEARPQQRKGAGVNEDLYVEQHGSTATLTLNRPDKRNAITFDMWCRLPRVLEEIEQDRSAKVLIIRGAGGAAFSAGADISEFGSLRSTEEGARRYNEATEAAEEQLAAMAKPTIAMVQGPCVGGGCELAVACDVRFSDRTGRFGITPAKLGIVYSLPATKRLVDLVGPGRAKYILFSGRHVGAECALEMGLVDELHEPHELAEATMDFAETVASRAQFSVRSTKRIVSLIMAGQAADNEETRRLRMDCFATDDYREGVRAFLEKRDPEFTYA